MNDVRLSKSLSKVKRQSKQKSSTLNSQREARVLAGQLAFAFMFETGCSKASDADCGRAQLALSDGKGVKKRVGVYSYLRWLG